MGPALSSLGPSPAHRSPRLIDSIAVGSLLPPPRFTIGATSKSAVSLFPGCTVPSARALRQAAVDGRNGARRARRRSCTCQVGHADLVWCGSTVPGGTVRIAAPERKHINSMLQMTCKRIILLLRSQPYVTGTERKLLNLGLQILAIRYHPK
jgi:hypothetical protein